MHDYALLSGCLRSELEFPDLSPIAGPVLEPDWVLRVSTQAPPVTSLSLLGEYDAGYTTARLHRTGTGFRLTYANTGSYDVTRDGREMVWYSMPAAPLELVTAVILGPVLALALHGSGFLCLHGSGVELAGRGVVFLAPKFHGKSTLAMALTAAGARLITDDAVVVSPDVPFTLLPATHSVRLWQDSAERLRVDQLAGMLVPGVKQIFTRLPRDMLVWEPVPLAAIYLLQSCRPKANEPLLTAATRSRVSLGQAAASLAQRTKLPDPLVGYGVAAADLQRAAAVVRHVPVYRLEVTRDWDRLPEVVEQIFTWHRVPAGVPCSLAE